MTEQDGRLKVAVLAIPEMTAATLYGMYDLFASAGRDWDFLVTGVPGTPHIQPLIVAATADSFTMANGIRLEPHCDLASCPRPDVVCVPEVFAPPAAELGQRYAAELDWLRRCYAAGAVMASACSGAMLLAEAGLLDGHEATTHWGYCDALATRFPAVRLRPERALVVSGDEQRLVMAGGGTSWIDLALYLVARYVGVEEAMRLAKLNVVNWHEGGQLPFASLVRARQSEDAVIGHCQAWIARHYDEESPVAAMVARSGLPERTFKRRFRKATGLAPMEYVHTLRLEESKQLLEAGDEPVEAVAHAVGYGDASFFSRLFRRQVGLTPAQYRRKFRRLRQALEAPA